jgi:hypothetical protein
LQAAGARTEATGGRRDTAPLRQVSSSGPPTARLQTVPTLSPAGVISLQRTAGNAAVTRLLASRSNTAGPPQPTAGGGLPVQRFPATALSAPVNWAQKTSSVVRPGEGVSGGVYILTSNETDPDIKRVVVKPVYGKTGLGLKETGEQLHFGDRLLSDLLGISTPTSRVVQGGSTEFTSLMTTVLPHKPPKPPPAPEGYEEAPWQDLAEAKQFVVMSEVPKARSVGSLAEKAMTDKDARTDFYKTLFNPAFIGELARISVGDLLIGNIDRFVMATNIGNLMVSTEGGEQKFYAIDTTPYLNKTKPEDMLDKGGNMNRNLTNTKKVTEDPTRSLHDFFDTVLSAMKGAAATHEKAGKPAVTSDEPAWKLFEDTYQRNKEKLEKIFLVSWGSTLSDVHFLAETKEGRRKMKDLTEEYKGTAGEDQLRYETLKARAMYLSGRAKRKGHDDSAIDPAVYLAYKQLQPLTAADFVPNDRFNPRAVGTLPAGAESANLPRVAGLPSPKQGIEDVVTGKGTGFDAQRLEKTGSEVDTAKSQLRSLGTKRQRSFLLSRGGADVERNRVKAGEFVADSYLVGAGAARLPSYLDKLSNTIDTFRILGKGDLGPAKTSSLVPLASSIPAIKRAIEESAVQYNAVLPGTIQSIRSIRRYKGRGDLATMLERIDAFVKRTIAKFGADVESKDPKTLGASLMQMPPLPQLPGGMPPLPPIPSEVGSGS